MSTRGFVLLGFVSLSIVGCTTSKDSPRRRFASRPTAGAGLAVLPAADTTFHFQWPTTESCYFRFANQDCVAIGVLPESWDADVNDSFGTIFFDTADTYVHATPYTVGSATVKVRFAIDDVEGSVDLSDHTGDWVITGHLAFNAGSVFSEGSCSTSPFEVPYRGDYITPTDSDPFTIPVLDGSATQSCEGHAAEIGAAFALGVEGAKVHFNKFEIALP